MGIVGDFRGLVRAFARPADELCRIAGPGCPYTLPIAGRPLIAHAVQALMDAGAREVVVAIDASIADTVAPALKDVRGAGVHVAIQPGEERAVERMGGGPLLEMTGDMLVGEIDSEAPAIIPVWRYDGTIDGVLEANTLALDDLKR